MSRAFVRESDDRPEPPIARPGSALPPGAKNYFTPGGANRLREDLRRLVEKERPALLARSPDPEAKRRLLILDQHIQQLEESLLSAEVVTPPAASARGVVRFGATVTVRHSDGEEDVYRIVGVDEIDLERSWVSWASPIAKALLNANLGERVRFKFPSGEEELEILKIEYEEL
ncbi:MAG: GreA/GreB family elongation factor [Verrucomicrobiota bacterium]|nr:GreA/GreB family elongation factor [Verrucomicrobiota bacterium]